MSDDLFERILNSEREPDTDPEAWASRALSIILTMAKNPEAFGLDENAVGVLVDLAAMAPNDTYMGAAAVLSSIFPYINPTN